MDTEKIKIQADLAKNVLIPTTIEASYQPKTGDYILSMDIQYADEIGYVAIDVMQYPNIEVEIFTHKANVINAYESGFFSFREGPPLLAALNEYVANRGIQPNLLIIDGHGIAHPRRLGVASYLGVLSGYPSIGVAKNTLLPYEGTLGEQRGDTLPIYLDTEVVGKVLRIQDGIKPRFVSAGHLVHLEVACAIALTLAPNYKNLEPIRRADNAARQFAKDAL